MTQQAIPFKQALETAWKEPTIKERHFNTPLALYAKRGYGLSGASADTAKGKDGKGKVQGGARRVAPRLTSPLATAAIPSLGAMKGVKCHFTHVCMKFFGDHPGSQCPKNSSDDSDDDDDDDDDNNNKDTRGKAS